MTPGNTSRNGFTLVEVLLAVLVLGIGLLGLAAVFPVVIAQQRQSSETIAATGVAASVEAMLFDGDGAPGLRAILRDPGFGRLAAINNGEPVASYNAVGAPTGSPQPSDANDAWVASGSLLWETTFTWQSTGFGAHNRLIGSFPNLMGVNRLADAVREVGLVQIGTGPYLEWDADNADFTIDNGGGARIPGAWQPTTNNDANVHPGVTTLPVDARLFPSPYSGAAPRFVWDLALRRTVDNTLEAVIFVRSIETGIRVPPGVQVSDVVTTLGDRNTVVTAARRTPVGMRSTNLRATGTGSNPADDAELYAHPISAAAWLPTPTTTQRVDNDIIVLKNPFDSNEIPDPSGYGNAIRDAYRRQSAGRPFWHDIVAQPGQTIVDNLGVVRRVVERVDDAPDWIGGVDPTEIAVRVSPPYTVSARRPEGESIESVPLEERSQKLFQVIFTPQVPVSVFIRELEVDR